MPSCKALLSAALALPVSFALLAGCGSDTDESSDVNPVAGSGDSQPAHGASQVMAPDTSLSTPSGDGGVPVAPTEDAALPDVGVVVTPGDPGANDVRCTVSVDTDARAISPFIYGTNDGIGNASEQRWGVLRSGGNRLTAYNWETNASNAGSDYMFQNDSNMSASNAPAKPLLDLIDLASSIGAGTIITLSNVDYVAADKNGDGDVRNSGANYLSTRFKRNHPKRGSAFPNTPNSSDADVYQDELVAFLKAQRPSARILFSLDNEPDLWSETHAEVYPRPVTYADLWKRNHDYAAAAKAVWPSAKTLGFVSYGFNGFTSLQNASDANGRNFIEWYLDQARAAEQAEGLRLIDYLDLHWYPEAQGNGERIISGGNSAAVVAAREQAPRSLWDASYRETSWVADAMNGPINLFSWLQTRIDAHYPGTQLAFSEWNFGGGDHISGAIAVADVLGLFGRHGVGLATYWPLMGDEPFARAGFRMFRNFDGQGGAFGDVSVAASTSDVASVAIYGSISSTNAARSVVVLVNRATTRKKVGLTIAHSQVYKTAKVWTLAGTTAAPVAGVALGAVATNAFSYDMPAQSVAVLVPEP